MKNITKTALFVSLIAVIILPFSVMSMIDAVPSENTNDNTTRTYEVEVISTEILDESYVDGVKVTKYKQTVRQTDMPTLKDFTEDNREYFDFLIDEYGQEGRNLVEQTKSEFTTDIENVRDQYEIEVMEYGEHSITFEP